MRAALLNGRKWLLLLFLNSPAAILDILKSVPPAQIGTGFDGTKVHILDGFGITLMLMLVRIGLNPSI